MTRAKDISKIVSDANFGGTLDVTGTSTLSGLAYPTSDGSANQFITTDGSGALSFATVDLTALSATNLTSGTVPTARVAGAYTGITSVGTLDVLGSAQISYNGANTYLYFQSTLNYIGRATDGNLNINVAGGQHILFGVSGAEKVRINSSGNVGIGNTASGFNAQADNLIVGSGSGDSGITIYSGSGSGDTGNIFFADGTSGDDPTRGGVTYNHGDNSMNFRVNDAPKMYINSSGNVGIGGTPTANLHVYRATGDASLIIETGEDSGAREPTLYLISYATNANPAIRFGDRLANNGFIEYENSDDSLRFGANASERMIIDSSGRLAIGTSSARGKLTVAMDAASSDGIMLDNANGGATMDISLLGSGYNAHGASPGEVWIYSPDNINIGGATGNGNHIKFLGNNTVRVLIHGSKPQVDYHGVKEYYYSGSLANSTIVVNLDIPNQFNSGVVLVQAGFNHYSINQYGAARTSNLGVYNGGIISTHDIQNISSGNGGSWAFSSATSGTIRVTKTAGTYAGGGHYWVKVTTYF